MPKLVCPCGYIHDLSLIPDAGWRTIRDLDYESVIEAEIELVRTREEEDKNYERRGPLIKRINSLAGLLYHCPECGRILWRRENSDEYTVYIAEPSRE